MNHLKKTVYMIPLLIAFAQCGKVLDQEMYSSIEMEVFYDSQSAAEIGITGCYNRFFNEAAYPNLICFFQVSTDDIYRPSGWGHQLKQRSTLLNSNPSSGGGYNAQWSSLYRTIANINLFLARVAEIPDEKFTGNRKKELLAEGHFLRGVSYYYLTMAWGDIPLILELQTGGPEDNDVAKSPRPEVISQIKSDLTIAATDLPPVLENYSNDPVTNQRKGRASKWAAKAYLSRIALMEGEYQLALDLSDEIIGSGLYPLAEKWRSIVEEPMNATEAIFEQQNDYSPGFFGSGLFGWFMGFEFQIAPEVYDLFQTADELKVTQGKDIRFEVIYGKHPWSVNPAIRKHVPPRNYENGGVEQVNITLIRATEVHFNKHESAIMLNYELNKQAALDFLNRIRARVKDDEWVNPHWPVPNGTTGIPPLTMADVDTETKMIQAIREEKRRELMYEDGIRWFDLIRWDKEYAKQITGSTTDDHLYLPIHDEELRRNNALKQNPAYLN